MGRHNREGRGADQRGYEYQVNYQPDWLRLIKVTRTLDSGRQSTKTLFRNPTHRRSEAPSEKVRTRLVSPGQLVKGAYELGTTPMAGGSLRPRIRFSEDGPDSFGIEGDH